MPGHRDWTPEEKALIDDRYRIWVITKDGRNKGKNVIRSLNARLMPRPPPPGTANAEAVMKELFDAWEARRWPQEIGKYYSKRFSDENGQPRLQRKTPEQIALLEKLFRKTGAYPYTGEQIAAAFLTGLELKQVRSWVEEQRKKALQRDEYAFVDFWDAEPPPDPQASRRMVIAYKRDPKAYARELVFGETDVCSGQSLGKWDVVTPFGLVTKPRCRVAESFLDRVSFVKEWEAWEARERAAATAGDETKSEGHGDE